MVTVPLATALPSDASNVAQSDIDDILASIATLSLSAGDAQRLITAICDSVRPSSAGSGSTSTGTSSETLAPVAKPVAAAPLPPSPPPAVISVTPTDVVAPAPVTTPPPVAAPAPVTTPVVVAVAPGPVAAPPVLPVAPVTPVAATPAPLPQALPQLPRPAMPAIPTDHFTTSHHGVLYLHPLQDVLGPYYLITKGRLIGVVANWNCASPLVIGVSGATFRKVATVGLGIQGIVSAINNNTVEYI